MNVSYHRERPFDGINNYLFNKKRFDIQKNLEVHGEKHVAISVNPIEIFNPLTTSSNFATVNDQNKAKVPVFYNDFLLNITHYTIRARTGDFIENMPKGWKLEGLLNQKDEWITLHSISNTNEILLGNSYHTYQCTNTGVFSQFKITMTQPSTGENNQGSNYIFHLNKIEFFGMVYTKRNPFIKPTCKSLYITMKYMFIALFTTEINDS